MPPLTGMTVSGTGIALNLRRRVGVRRTSPICRQHLTEWRVRIALFDGTFVYSRVVVFKSPRRTQTECAIFDTEDRTEALNTSPCSCLTILPPFPEAIHYTSEATLVPPFLTGFFEHT